jgi:hypothetical protein
MMTATERSTTTVLTWLKRKAGLLPADIDARPSQPLEGVFLAAVAAEGVLFQQHPDGHAAGDCRFQGGDRHVVAQEIHLDIDR